MGQWSYLYNDRSWRKARAYFLVVNPLCKHCKEIERVTVATIVDHIVPHQGDVNLFWDKTNWQALCKRHHDTKTANNDNNHAFGRWQKIPQFVKPPCLPVHIVTGPPASGKTTYCERRMTGDSLLIDVDYIAAKLSEQPVHQVDMDKWLVPSMLERNAMLGELHRDVIHDAAFFIVSAPKRNERNKWRELLHTESVTVLQTDAATCIERIDASDRRQKVEHTKAVKSWWRQHTSDPRTEQIVMSG